VKQGKGLYRLIFFKRARIIAVIRIMMLESILHLERNGLGKLERFIAVTCWFYCRYVQVLLPLRAGLLPLRAGVLPLRAGLLP